MGKSLNSQESVFVEVFSSDRFFDKNGPVVAVKDSIDVAAYTTKGGCQALDDRAPAICDAEVVERILVKGCRLIGKLNMHELAFGVTGINPWTGTPVNPSYPDFIPGGSSSASAVAVASGQLDFSLGTDTGGSVRMPAACCGVYGLKPTFNRISRRGVMPVDSSLDCIGPFARSIDGIILAMSIIDDNFDVDIKLPDRSISIGKLKVFAESNVQAIVDQKISELTASSSVKVVDVELPSMTDAFEAGLTVINAESWQAYGDLTGSGKLGKDVETRLLLAKKTSKQDLIAAELVRKKFTAEVDAALAQMDLLILPTLPRLPLKLDAALNGEVDLSITSLVRPFNLSGHPALSIPIKSQPGRPIALQLVAAKGQDELLCAITKLLKL